MKEILKEIAPGAFTHDYWVDDEGNIIVEPDLTVQEAFDRKAKQLLNSYYSRIKTTVQYMDKTFGCNDNDQDSIDKIIYTIDKGIFPYEGMSWNTYLGEEVIFLSKDQIQGLKVAIIMQDQEKWVEYNMLMGELKSINLGALDAMELINNIPLVN